VVVTTTPGRNPRIEVSCVIHTRPLERQELTQAFRRQWREAKLVELQKSIDFAIAEEQRKQVELVEKRKVASGQLAELVGAMKRSEGLVAQYEQCLSSHRIADKFNQVQFLLSRHPSRIRKVSSHSASKKLAENDWKFALVQALSGNSPIRSEAVWFCRHTTINRAKTNMNR
jgi:hypothetical protein